MVGSSNLAWDQKLKRVAEEIRAEARGRTCSHCAHYHGHCNFTMTLLETDVVLHAPNAVACRHHWKPRKRRRRWG